MSDDFEKTRKEIMRSFAEPKKKSVQKRASWEAAKVNNFGSRWITSEAQTTITDQIAGDLPSLRAQSRKAMNDNPHAQAYAKVLQDEIIGGKGIQLTPRSHNKDGKEDVRANIEIKQKWEKWSKNVSVCGMDISTAQKVFILNLKRDGEVLIHKLRGPSFKGGLQLQFLDPEFLDPDFSKNNLQNGNEIKGSIEIDKYGRVVAYHLWKRHPGDPHQRGGTGSNSRIRVPANDIIFAFERVRAHQYRGIPALASCLIQLNRLDKFVKSTLVGAVVSSMQLGFISPTVDSDDLTTWGPENDPETENDSTNDEILYNLNLEPGQFNVLPPNYRVDAWSPTIPTTGMDAFSANIIKSVAAALNVAPFRLSGDLSNTNYSSLRMALIQEKSHFESMQNLVIEQFLNPLYEEWLNMSLLNGELSLPESKVEKWMQIEWACKAYDWVDPQKQVSALTMQLEKGLTSKTHVIKTMLGREISDVYDEIAKEQELAKSLGIDDTTLNNSIENKINPDDEDK